MTFSSEIIAADIGGTHARFALARRAGADAVMLSDIATLDAAAYPTMEAACLAYGALLGRTLPAIMAMAVASPVEGDALKMTNNPWVIRPSVIRATLRLERLLVINDFAAVGHAVAIAAQSDFERLCGPERGLPQAGVISVIGAGTGLGVAQVLRQDGRTFVLATEGGHIDFAPLDDAEDAILAALRPVYGRISVERILSGPGLFNLYRALGHSRAIAIDSIDHRMLWTRAIDGTDPLAKEALQRFCLTLGSVCGDLALAQGASAVVLAGGLLPRIVHLLPGSGFEARFRAKGRFQDRMADIPIFRILHPQPGLLGAAAAFTETG